MSDELKAFYKAYCEWLDAGAPQRKPFSRGVGLCLSLDYFSGGNPDLLEEMYKQFISHGLNGDYPFDKDWFSYRNDANKHLNKDRVSWVRKNAGIQ